MVESANSPEIEEVPTNLKDCGHPASVWCACQKFRDYYQSEQDADSYRDVG